MVTPSEFSTRKAYCRKCKEITDHDIQINKMDDLVVAAFQTCKRCRKQGTYFPPNRKWGSLAFLFGIAILAFFWYLVTSYSARVDILQVMLVAIVLLPGCTLFIVGFRELLPAKSTPLERIYPKTLKILGIYLGLFGLLAFIGNIFTQTTGQGPMGTGGAGAAVIVTLLCAAIALMGINMYNKGKKLSSD